ncbi:MAG TPA: hypothetical protein VIQ05_25305 [Tardiphaga sp.]
MSDWMMSGADASCPREEAIRYQQLRRGRRRRRRRMAWLAGVLTLAGAASSLTHAVMARDNGQYATTSPDLKAWFDSLRSGKGPCCSDADGSAVSDVDWESSSGHYRVRLDGKWLDVPDEAVITSPNRVGRTMVWPMRGDGGILIRCFMPGSMT